VYDRFRPETLLIVYKRLLPGPRCPGRALSDPSRRRRRRRRRHLQRLTGLPRNRRRRSVPPAGGRGGADVLAERRGGGGDGAVEPCRRLAGDGDGTGPGGDGGGGGGGPGGAMGAGRRAREELDEADPARVRRYMYVCMYIFGRRLELVEADLALMSPSPLSRRLCFRSVLLLQAAVCSLMHARGCAHARTRLCTCTHAAVHMRACTRATVHVHARRCTHASRCAYARAPLYSLPRRGPKRKATRSKAGGERGIPAPLSALA
jgi:hypothetical protein